MIPHRFMRDKVNNLIITYRTMENRRANMCLLRDRHIIDFMSMMMGCFDYRGSKKKQYMKKYKKYIINFSVFHQHPGLKKQILN